jgi:protein-L-isoaspartate(D-aspartate) O-methyltransferase
LSFVAAIRTDDPFAKKRTMLLDEIKREVALTSLTTGRKLLAASTLKALAEVPRHRFVDKNLEDAAYDNRPLSIGFGQTISQPYIVAIMTDLLDLDSGQRVLEIGTGSGYQAAVLSLIVAEVHSIEIIPELAKIARERLKQLSYDNVHVHMGNGYHGLPEKAPFDAVIVTAAASHIPPPLLAQLKVGGKMIIPIGSPFAVQSLFLLEKRTDGIKQTNVLTVQFVPFTGEIPKIK